MFVGNEPSMVRQPDILLVEDEPALVELIGRILRRAGYAMRAVSDGATALAVLSQQPPAMLILDLVLPTMSGWEIITQLRRDQRSIPIIVVTANPRVAKPLASFGVNRYLIKPFYLNDLLDAVSADYPLPDKA